MLETLYFKVEGEKVYVFDRPARDDSLFYTIMSMETFKNHYIGKYNLIDLNNNKV